MDRMFINLISISSICFSCLHHSSFENDQFIELRGMAVYLCYFLFRSLVFYHPMNFIYHLKLEFMSSFSKLNHNFLSQNSALSCVFESLPDLFTLL